ncbi:hypothetical protein AB9P05_12920 [Roseivirga sp. BDSF3-8]|uniref:hypothetical protein n=1 Tax=Roseivirga sp. BDSF3-8 TaxID=3241598 RepID=UPI00353267A5
MKPRKAWSEIEDYLEQLPESNTTAKWKGGFMHVFDRSIFCRYEYVRGIKYTWILETGDTLICQELHKEKTFDVASIKEFAYVLEPYGDRRFWTENVGGKPPSPM